MSAMETETITLPLSYEERQYLRNRRSEVTRQEQGEPTKRFGPTLKDTHEAWVSEVERAMAEYDHIVASSKSRSVLGRLASLS